MRHLFDICQIQIDAPTSEDCDKSENNILALQKFVEGDESGVANFTTIDTLNVELNGDGFLPLVYCHDWSQYAIIRSDEDDENFGGIRRAWTFNPDRMRIIEVNPDTLDCLNEGLIIN